MISRRIWVLFALAAIVSVPAMATTPIVYTVPWDPSSPSTPHDTYAGATVSMGATVPNIYLSPDSYTYQWNYGDGTPLGPVTALPTGSLYSSPGPYNIGTTHVYAGAVGTIWTATVTVTDTISGAVGSNSYLVEMQQNTLTHTVNVAIDKGLWFLHASMWRTNTPANSEPVNWGGWDDEFGSPGCVAAENCFPAGGLDATNVQAFEVKGHLETGSPTDPYTDDVARGLARMEYFLIPEAVNDVTGASFQATKDINYNPAVMAVRCSDGTQPTSYGPPPVCGGGATPISYNPGATSCTSPPCQIVYDLNSNGQMIYEGNDYGDPGYQMGMFVDAFVASGNPAGTAKAGPAGVLGESYLNVVTDIIDAIGYCESAINDTNSNGADSGGAWQYYCAGNSQYYYAYNDNSPSQWNAIGMIGASRAFGVNVLPIVKDTNQVWTIWSQEVPVQATTLSGGSAGLQFTPPYKLANSDSLVGAYGYSEWGYEPWGPFADTPSGMVQLAMDDIGRTASGAADQRWNLAESFYHDNFCNGEGLSPNSTYYSDDAGVAPRWYMYGLFSFTKAMLEHDPGGVLTPLNFLEDEPSGTNPIDWYGAQLSAGAPCDGVAQTLVSRQQADGSWYYYSYYPYQFYFDTAWAVIMLNKTVFVQCISNLAGRGTPGSGAISPTVNLTWSAQTNAVSYNVLRSTTTGGPYSLVGNTTFTAFSDRTAGLVNGNAYYFVVQPVNASNTDICQSNEAAIKIP
jgi:hypothetical protein